MKPLLIGIGLMLLIGSGATLAAYCTYQHPATTEVSLLYDITDTGMNVPYTADILPLYGLNGSNEWQGGRFHLADLSDVSYGASINLSLPPANKWLSNEFDRQKEVTGFETGITQSLVNAAQTPTGKAQSSLYLPIATELEALHASTATSRVLIIASDLMENTATLSFYTPATFSLLHTYPDAVHHLLDSIHPLPSLQGIHIYLLYYPATPLEDNQYRIVSAFYRTLFEQHGATVTIGTLHAN